MRKLLTKQKPILSAALAILLIFIGMTGCAKKRTVPTTTPSPTPTSAELSLTPTPSPSETNPLPETTPTPLATMASSPPWEEVTPTAPTTSIPNPSVTPASPSSPARPATATPHPSETATLRPPSATPSPTVAPTSSATPIPAIEYAPQSFVNDIFKGVNWARANLNNPPPQMTLDAALCEEARLHAVAMAKAGRLYHSDNGIESIERQPFFGQWMGGEGRGAAAAAHATGLLKEDTLRLGVGAVAYNGNIYIVVRSTTWNFD